MFTYRMWLRDIPESGDRKEIKRFAKALKDDIDTQSGEFMTQFGHEPDTLLLAPDTPDAVEHWFGNRFHVKRHALPRNHFGLA